MAPAIKGLRVLIVDDNVDSAEMFGLLVQALGHQARVCTKPMEALGQFRAFRPHAVLLDIRMPGMDGFAVARQMREEGAQPRPALIAITGFDKDEHRTKAELDFDFYFRKPVPPKVIQGLLEAVLGYLSEHKAGE